MDARMCDVIPGVHNERLVTPSTITPAYQASRLYHPPTVGYDLTARFAERVFRAGTGPVE